MGVGSEHPGVGRRGVGAHVRGWAVSALNAPGCGLRVSCVCIVR